MSIPGSASPLFFTAAADAAAAGPIKSVRFNRADSAYLNKSFSTTGNQKTFTISLWIKKCLNTTSQYLFTTEHTGGDYFEFTSNADQIQVYNNASTSVNVKLERNLRDPSAWYHLVLAVDTTQATQSDRLKIYVNGEHQTDYADSTFPAQNYTFDLPSSRDRQIGAANFSGSLQGYFDGYMADFYFIDGAAKDVTDFGAFDDNGVWQAAAYSGTFGTNGFHLFDFANESGIGNDSSGNDNDFTVNNISTFPTAGPYVSQVSGSDYNATYSKVKMFDSNEVSSYLAGDSSTVTWTIPGGLSFSSQLRVRAQGGGATGTITFNWSGGSYDLTVLNAGAQYYDVTSNVTSPITSITWTTGASSVGPYVSAWEVDGSLLLDASQTAGEDVLRDVPTNGDQSDTGAGGEVSGNYATLNPLAKHNTASPIFSNGNLEITDTGQSGYNNAVSTIGVSSGKWYVECTNEVGAYNFVGIQQGPITDGYIGNDSAGNGWSYAAEGYVRHARTNKAYGSVTYGAGDVIGIALDLDSATKTLTFYKNGTSLGTAYSGSELDADVYHFGGTLYTTNDKQVWNFGARSFVYNAPTGFKALCTTNLPTPTVADGSDYFETVLWTGDGTNNRKISTPFSPDWVWVKDRGNAYSHRLFDTVRGDDKGLVSNSTAAEGTVSLGMESDGFVVEGSSSYNDNTDSYVAWTWDAGSSTVSNTDGSITASVRANQTAGFSIVSFTAGSTSSYTVGHGLNAKPHFMIFKDRDTAGQPWIIYHDSLGSSKYLLFSTAAEATASWGGDPTSSVFYAGTTFFVNGVDVIGYCFAPVAGFSAFGSYTGNGSSNGPFIYTGFKPAWVLYKKSNSTSDWYLDDYKREGYNSTNNNLYPNDPGVESTGVFTDFFSNGFQLVTASSVRNGSGDTFIYAAFAENPFQANGGLAR